MAKLEMEKSGNKCSFAKVSLLCHFNALLQCLPLSVCNREDKHPKGVYADAKEMFVSNGNKLHLQMGIFTIQ